MRVDLLEGVRDGLPPRLNAGILMGDGGFCILGWMLMCAGFHPITIYNSTIVVADPERGGPAIEVVARAYEMPVEVVRELAEVNDRSETPRRREAVKARLNELIAGERR